MNPLKSIKGTIISGLVVAVVLSALIAWPQTELVTALERWVHFLSGVTWIGLLYYFNFVQVPAMAAAAADTDGPGPAAIGKYVAPLALLWFRWAAVVTWISGAMLLASLGNVDFVDAFTLSGSSQVIGVGAWLGTIMLINVWVFIWPNQKKVLGMVAATDEEKNKARTVALMASRTNTLLSIPMLLFMGASAHGLPF
ncbi:MAG: hypothetical protein CMO26_22790 [Thiotrichales bacterium]|nr:hypothetical protein [Thiotrichales bacterium]|tara:strand:+ start:56 stop:646 length:591 start_codon:yes stop_codon:yes gene_type:complete